MSSIKVDEARKIILEKIREEFISSGDFLMVVKNNYHWLPESSDGEFIANGEIAKVIRIRNEQEMYGLKFADASLQLVDFPTHSIPSIVINKPDILSCHYKIVF